MSLTAAQTRILRDTAGGAELGMHTGTKTTTLRTKTKRHVSRADALELLSLSLIELGAVRRSVQFYALTPAAAAAAGEGAE